MNLKWDLNLHTIHKLHIKIHLELFRFYFITNIICDSELISKWLTDQVPVQEIQYYSYVAETYTNTMLKIILLIC